MNIITNLSNYGLIKAEGDDAETFLHNQFTNDLKLINETQSQLSAYCSPKGRILSLFRIVKRDNAFYLRMPGELVPPTLKRLRMFILMSKVTLEDASESLRHIGIAGVDAESQLKQKIDQLPAKTDGVTTSNNLTIIRVPGTEPRFEIFGPADEITKLQQTLEETIAPAGTNEWELLDIQAGIPTIHPQNVEAFVPQMVNLQAINGMSFKKGCYPGQEIIARMQYLGKLKRRMYLVSARTDQCPKPADSVFINENGEERKVGSVVSAQLNNDGCVNALIVIEIAVENNPNLYFSEQNTVQLETLPLPYVMET